MRHFNKSEVGVVSGDPFIAFGVNSRVAVADGKEIAANTIQCAAEAESLLAKAKRFKAITPLCVSVGATVASFALLVPVVIQEARTV